MQPTSPQQQPPMEEDSSLFEDEKQPRQEPEVSKQ